MLSNTPTSLPSISGQSSWSAYSFHLLMWGVPIPDCVVDAVLLQAGGAPTLEGVLAGPGAEALAEDDELRPAVLWDGGESGADRGDDLGGV